MRVAVIHRLQIGISWGLMVALAGCGGGGSSSNTAPTANAGSDQSVAAGAAVTLAGSGTDSDGSIASYAWTQTAGSSVTLSSTSIAGPTFTAPVASSSSSLTFSLTVTDNQGGTSTADTVTVNVLAGVAVTGKVTFARVPFFVGSGGLDYAGTTQLPAQLITVEAVDATSQASLASTQTDTSGDYTLLVPGAKNMQIRAKAEMVRAAPQALPHYQYQVRDVDGANTPYTYAGTAFNSGATASTQNVDIPSGWDANTRTARTDRASAPFAILDTVLKATNFVLTVSPTADFPQLTLDWAISNPGAQSFYDNDAEGTPAGLNRKITLAGEADVDTDEFDESVIAHEFGHYIEDNFSRSDSIGDAHAPGDRLDPRVAFGEGFGSAFSAMVFNDPVLRDSYGSRQLLDSAFNVEQNTNFIVNAQSTEGWYSEASMQEILWDLFDTNADGESVALGFAPIWSVLTGTQKATDAVTSIFPFIVALKAENAGEASNIDSIVGAEHIVAATMDPFGGTETNNAGVTTTTDVLPIYTPISVDGGSVVVRSIQTFGTPNKLSNHRFLLLDLPSQASLRFTATAASGRDVDLYVLHQGGTAAFGEGEGDENFTATLPAGRYVLDTYDCDNAGCSGAPTPSPADTDITVTVTTN